MTERRRDEAVQALLDFDLPCILPFTLLTLFPTSSPESSPFARPLLMSSSNWVELSHFLASPPHAPPAYLGALPPAPPSINALSFDTSSDLLLTGNSNGGVTSWYGQGLARYTAWKADVRLTVPIPGSEAAADTDPLTAPRRLQTSWKKASQNQASTSGTKAGIRELYNDSGNVWSVSQHGVHCASRRGIARWGKDVAAMGHPSLTLSSISPSPSGSSSEIVVGGPEATLQDSHIISINRHVGSISRKVAVSGANVLQLRKSQRYILNSTSAGHIHLRDPRSLEMLHTLHAHPGGIIDMKSEGHLVWSIGWTIRLGHPVVESHVKGEGHWRLQYPEELSTHALSLSLIPQFTTFE